MGTITIRPEWDGQRMACPACGTGALAYEGSVRWRSGPRPGRELATKGPVGFAPRGDFETAHDFPCEGCGGRFYDAVDGSRPRLSVEGRRGEQGG
jgi:hypothetical protein